MVVIKSIIEMKIYNKSKIVHALVCLSVLLFFAACKNELADDLIHNQCYIVKSGERIAPSFNGNKKNQLFFSVYKSGWNKGVVTMSVKIDEEVLKKYNQENNTEYELLPADTYKLSKTNINIADGDVKDIIYVDLDLDAIKKILPVNTRKYAIPIKVINDSNVPLVEEMSDLVFIPELVGGIRPNSEVTLWSKTLEEMGIAPLDKNTVSFAVTTNYLFVNTRGQDLRYYDRFTGEYVGTIVLPAKGSLVNFSMTSDKKGNVLISNLRRGTSSANQTIYRIKGTGEPEVYINTTHTYPNGRKLSLIGDLDGDAIITSVFENAPQVAYWEVKGGKLLSQEPKVYTASAEVIKWKLQADAFPVSLDINDGMYLAGSEDAVNAKVGSFDADGQPIALYDLVTAGLDPASGFYTHSIDVCTFNHEQYMALGTLFKGTNDDDEAIYSMLSRILKVRNPEDLASPSLVYENKPIECFDNTVFTGDVILATSNEGQNMELYTLGTNGGISAVQFDCKGDDELSEDK